MIYEDARHIIDTALADARPDAAVARALESASFGSGRIVLISIGKAAWSMAASACAQLGRRITEGVVVTKYGHSMGALPGIRIVEAGHPLPDANSILGADTAIAAVSNLTADDTVLFLVSGGGSALFEKPLIDLAALEDITRQLLACGANIAEINTIRKRLSAVKGGRFAKLCAPAQIFSIVLSDIIGDPLDMIASGPAYPDGSTCQQALDIVQKYMLQLDADTLALLRRETPKTLDHVTTIVTGSVRQLCRSAEAACQTLGYMPFTLTDSLTCTARDAGSFLASIVRFHRNTAQPLAFIAGGETVVVLKGDGKGGRNQELALAAAAGIAGLSNAAIFSIGSDGTDGPTDAAGGYVDGETLSQLAAQGIDLTSYLDNNDAYTALKAVDRLIITGPTGTNVNDLTVALIRPASDA